MFLDDVTEHNGPLVFIRGSHLGGPVRTALDTETTSYALWTVDNETVARLARAGGLQTATGVAGTALIFGDCLVHGSPPNMSPWDRSIFSVILNPIANAQTRFARPDYKHHRDFPGGSARRRLRLRRAGARPDAAGDETDPHGPPGRRPLPRRCARLSPKPLCAGTSAWCGGGSRRSAELIACVEANAYGHGVLPVSACLGAAGVRWLSLRPPATRSRSAPEASRATCCSSRRARTAIPVR